ncbi:hypothetical protein HPY228_07140 [Helicobacter pylori]|nr:replicative DNA helicase [Helicobacter phage Pt22899G]KHL84498.1 hypothetical protein HPY228_07140 [Helicobacter pylori]
MENLIIRSFLDYPQHIEDFLEDISVKSFSAFNQKVIKALVEMNRKNQPIRLETIKLKIGEKDFESKEFQAILPKTNALKPLAFSYGDTRRNAFRRANME